MRRKFELFLLLSLLVTTINAQTTTEKTAVKKSEEVTFLVGMHCQSCKERIEKIIPFEKGVKDLKVDLEKKEVTVVYNPQKTTEDKLRKAFKDLGYTCEKKEQEKKEQ